MILNRNLLDSKSGKAIYVGGVTILLSALGGWAVLAHQDSATPVSSRISAKTSQSAKSSLADTHFAKEAAQGGMAEVKLGQLAQEKGTSEAVKRFGKRMVEDHSKAGDELKETAGKESINLPTAMAAKDQALYDRLSKLSGVSFDRAYARDMVKDHESDVAAFKHEANSGKNEAIKNFAAKTLPTLEDHLKEAKEMAGKVTPVKMRSTTRK